MPTQLTRSRKSKPSKPLFAPGQICYPDEVQQLLAQAGIQGIALVCQHLTGQWGEVDHKRQWLNRWAIAHPQDERRLPIISRFSLPGSRQVMVITYHVHAPARRRTHLALWPPALKTPLEPANRPEAETPTSQPADDKPLRCQKEASHVDL